MSFILDALKKSEIERQRQTVPGLMDTRITPRRRRLPVWAVALAVLLGINLIVLIVVLTRSSTQTVTSATARHVADPQSMHHIDRTSETEAAPPAPEHFSPLDTTPVYAPEIPVPAADKPIIAPSPTGHAATAGGVGTVHSLHRPDPLLIDDDTVRT